MSAFSDGQDAAALETEVGRRLEELLRAEHEQLTARAEAAERECQRLRQEIGEVGACLRKILSDMRQPPREGRRRSATVSTAGAEL
ncbi:MAG: hypothetical protein ACREMB_12260 [Candidatus Rokuibacteriota bacterium]